MAEMGEGDATAEAAEDEEHSHAEVKLVDIKDADGNSIKDGASEYDTRLYAVKDGKQTIFEVEVKNEEALVQVSIEVDPENKIAAGYYPNYLIPVSLEFRTPDTHEIEWDGRSNHDGRRLLVEGDYKIKIDSLCPGCLELTEEESTIKVKKPYAHAYGAAYPDTQGDFSGEAARVPPLLESLPDGSGFDSSALPTASALDALANLEEKSAVVHWTGHGERGIIDFYATLAHNTSIATNKAVGAEFSMPATDIAAVEELDEGALNDVFLIVLHGCYSARSPSGADSLLTALTKKGADLVIGFRLGVPGSAGPKWIRDFYGALKKKKGVFKAAKIAKAKAAPGDRRDLSFRIKAGSGAQGRQKLLPARYGRKKN